MSQRKARNDLVLSIRRATPDDAKGVADVLNSVIREGDCTAFDKPFTETEERSFIASLGKRSCVLIAEVKHRVVGVQVVDLFASYSNSMRHVATMGTWILAGFRGHRTGQFLAEESFRFALDKGYTKVIIQVLAINDQALRFYRRLGFEEIGLAKAHVKLGANLLDAVYLEKILEPERG